MKKMYFYFALLTGNLGLFPIVFANNRRIEIDNMASKAIVAGVNQIQKLSGGGRFENLQAVVTQLMQDPTVLMGDDPSRYEDINRTLCDQPRNTPGHHCCK